MGGARRGGVRRVGWEEGGEWGGDLKKNVYGYSNFGGRKGRVGKGKSGRKFEGKVCGCSLPRLKKDELTRIPRKGAGPNGQCR